LQRSGKGAGALNPRYPIGREEDSEWFDRAFFAGAWPKDGTDAVGRNGTALRPWTRHPWLVKVPARITRSWPDDKSSAMRPPATAAEIPVREDAAAYAFLRGAFNVNCREPESWRLALARRLPSWQRQTVAGNPPTASKDLSNVLFRLPFGADQARRAGNAGASDLLDEDLGNTYAATQTRCEGLQGFRALSARNRDKLAEALATGIKDYQERERGGFRTLREFAESGVLAEAIERAYLNTKETVGKVPAPMSPLRLNSGDILESLLPVLTTRGDTFKIRARGSVLSRDGKEEAHADIEAVVQRYPDFFDPSQSPMTPQAELNALNRRFGRRMRIVTWRWLAPGE
jgi:hypothetical protein